MPETDTTRTATQVNARLREIHDGPGELPARVAVYDNRSIEVAFDGFGDYNCAGGPPVVIENRNGVPYVIVWADLNDEEPTHVISLDGAHERHRIEMKEE